MYHRWNVYEIFLEFHIHWTNKQTNTSSTVCKFYFRIWVLCHDECYCTPFYFHHIYFAVFKKLLKLHITNRKTSLKVHIWREKDTGFIGFHFYHFPLFSMQKKLWYLSTIIKAHLVFAYITNSLWFNHVWKYLKYLIQQNPKTASTIKTKI